MVDNVAEPELEFFPNWVAGRPGYAARIRSLFEEHLAKQELRLTTQRRKILDYLLGSKRHVEFEEIYKALRKEGIGRATVFRTMRLLLDLNIVCRVLLDGGNLHYRISSRGHHHHLVCNDCGRVEDFTGCDVEPLVQALAAAMKYEIDGHWLEVYGRCEACRLLRSGRPESQTTQVLSQ